MEPRHVIKKEGGDITYKDMVDDTSTIEESQIRKVFAGTTIMLTGGTGFLGKLIIEKLLRCCPELNKIYILARPKKNKDTKKRLEEQFDDVLYDKLRKENPEFLKQVTIVEGDMGEVNLGMKESDRKLITEQADIIFHGAATVRFDEPLKTAVNINVRGTREMLLLARDCKKLRAFTYVSTAYSNCIRTDIEEKFYDMQLPADKLIEMMETMDESTINGITQGLLGQFPNTYAYTKAAAEDIVKKYAKGLPVVVFRPSIVIGTVKEPVSGWIDNVYGPTGVVVGAGVGLLHVLNCNPKAVADLVPGDMVVNCCIAAAWKAVMDYPSNTENLAEDFVPPIYNFVSSTQKPLTWEKFMKYTEIYGLEVPTTQAVWYYLFLLTPSKTMFNIYSYLLHWAPAYIIDGIAQLVGKKPVLKKAYTKIEKYSEVIAYFALRDWQFSDQNVRKLFQDLNGTDQDIFNFNIADLDWADYFYSYIRGIRVYLIKDPMDTIGDGLKKYYKLKAMHYLVVSLVFYGAFKLIIFVLKLLFSVVS